MFLNGRCCITTGGGTLLQENLSGNFLLLATALDLHTSQAAMEGPESDQQRSKRQGPREAQPPPPQHKSGPLSPREDCWTCNKSGASIEEIIAINSSTLSKQSHSLGS